VRLGELTKENILDHVEIDHASGCWVWKFSRNNKNYGRKKTKQRNSTLAHRLSYEIFKGRIPEGLIVCHKCDNPPCCNPDHLFVGTFKDNSQDCIAKGRNRAGEKGVQPEHLKHCKKHSKLTPSQRLEVVRRYSDENECRFKIASEFGIKPHYVYLLASRLGRLRKRDETRRK